MGWLSKIWTGIKLQFFANMLLLCRQLLQIIIYSLKLFFSSVFLTTAFHSQLSPVQIFFSHLIVLEPTCYSTTCPNFLQPSSRIVLVYQSFCSRTPAKFFKGFLFSLASVRDVLFYFLKFFKKLKTK